MITKAEAEKYRQNNAQGTQELFNTVQSKIRKEYMTGLKDKVVVDTRGFSFAAINAVMEKLESLGWDAKYIPSQKDEDMLVVK